MQINRSLMDQLFDYNNRVGTASTLERKIKDFEKRAAESDSPEERARYAQAVKDIQESILPEIQQQVSQMGKSLGLDEGQIGLSISPEDLKKDRTRHAYNGKGNELFYIEDPTGEFLSTKT